MNSTRFWLLGLLLLVLAGCRFEGVVTETPLAEMDGGDTAVPTLTDIDAVETLQRHFNEDAAQVRLVLLLSPT